MSNDIPTAPPEQADRPRLLTSSPPPPGLLGDDDGATDLGTLEKKLAEKVEESRQASQAAASNPVSPSQATSGHDGSVSVPQSPLTSPEPSAKDDKRKSLPPDANSGGEAEEEVEALSEMMCSLVTNNCGETRYIGESQHVYAFFSATSIFLANSPHPMRRLFVRFLHILSQGNPVGEREDGRQVFPADDHRISFD